MPVIGTAGHVDHGKSTLIQALTGRNPDRLDEEKRRGLTIDLGFAWTELEDGTTVGFVDVPGHERFIKNMLAGIEAVQGVLFVVAADEGWMPQSEEHLAIIDLLDQRNGVVALSRRDLVDDDTAALATLEVEEALAGTSLAGSPIVEVSPPTGLGIEELRHELAQLVGRVTSSGRTRMWIDRSFTIAGSGTVVTGTLSGGSISVGEEFAIWPGPVNARVRGLQSHERAVDSAAPGSRTAMNLGGVGLDAIGRGSMAGRPGEWQPTDVFLASIRAARGMEEAIADRGAYHLHAGSGAWPMRLRLVGEDAALITVAEAVPLAMGDRFILRDVGRRAVVGGGRVLDPAPRGRPSAAAIGVLRSALDGSDVDRANALAELRGRASVSAIAAHSGGVPSAALTTVGAMVFSDDEVSRIRRSARAAVSAFHAANPLRPGMPSASLAERLDLAVDQLAALIGDDLIIETSYVREVGFHDDLDAQHRDAQELVRTKLTESGLAVPRASQLGISLELRHALERKGVLIRVDHDLVYLPDQIERVKGVVEGLGEGFTVSEFRDACGISRRQAVPLLEWLDRTGVTERFGDQRRLRKR
jgi:selenocysteine-specific elongation factor